MRIRDIKLEEIRQGKNWKLVNSREMVGELALEEVSIETAEHFGPEDYVVYSALFATDSGEAHPIVIIKEVGSPEYGGDECEFVDGKWQQVGLVPNPNAPFGNEYFANPLAEDPSFDADEDQDERGYHRQKFQEWATRL